MKKTFALLLALLMMTSTASAVSIDTLSLDELMDLRIRIEERIIELSEDWSLRVPMGIYEVGKDVPAGSYSVESEKGNRARFMLSSSYEKALSNTVLFSEYLSEDKEFGKIIFSDGQFLKIEDNAVLLRKYKGLSFE
jgi:hypothetical protein